MYVGIQPQYAHAEIGNELYESPNGTTNDATWGTNTDHRAWTYRPQNNQYVCSVGFYMRNDSDVTPATSTVTVYLYTNSNATTTSYTMGSLLATTTSKTGTDFVGNTTNDYEYFEFPNCQGLTGGSDYVFVMTIADGNVTNYYFIRYNANAVYEGTISRWFLLSTVNPNHTGTFKVSGLADLTIRPFSTSTISLTGLSYSSRDCSSYSGGIFSSSTLAALGCYGMKIVEEGMIFFFIPNASSTGVTAFNNAIYNFTDVFPFNIFFTFANTISSEAYVYEITDTAISWTLPTSTPGTLSFSSSTLNSYLGSGTWTTIRLWESYALWILLLFGIVWKVKAF